MIFLSHNSKDKEVVEPIFIELLNDQRNEVFYDSWSIQPGQSIVGKMNEGLSKTKTFILFWSINAAKSSAVNIEWTVILSKYLSDRTIKILIVRLDETEIPQILSDLVYLNMYEEGHENIVDKIKKVIFEENVFVPKYRKFINVTVKMIHKNQKFSLMEVEAKSNVEHELIYGFISTTPLDDFELMIQGEPLTYHAEPGVESDSVSSGTKIYAKSITDRRRLVPGNKKTIVFKFVGKGNMPKIEINPFICDPNGNVIEFESL